MLYFIEIQWKNPYPGSELSFYTCLHILNRTTLTERNYYKLDRLVAIKFSMIKSIYELKRMPIKGIMKKNDSKNGIHKDEILIFLCCQSMQNTALVILRHLDSYSFTYELAQS